MLDFSERLYSLLVSPYSYIQIRTYEEDRIIQTVRALADQLNRPIVEWAPDDREAGGFLTRLNSVEQRDQKSIIILKDAHPYLNTPRIVRKLRELERKITKRRQVLIFISPFVDLPRELIKDFTFLDAPLPGRVELSAVLDEVFKPAKYPDLPRERLVAGALGLTMREARRAFFRARFERRQSRKRGVKHFDLEAAVVREKRRLIEADQILEFVELSEDLSNVGGLDALKAWLSERQRAFTTEAVEFGLPTPRGLLLTGVPGCGKSLFAKAIAGYWGIPLLRLDIIRLFDGSLSPEAALNRVVHTAEALSPAVLWLDEIEKAFGDAAGGVATRLMGSLLNWLQTKTRPVFFVATANRVSALPPELLRKGRFDDVFFVDLPSKNERVDILNIHVTQRNRRPEDFKLDSLADRAQFFSGAELEQVVVSGLYKAFGDDRELTQVDLEAAIQETIPLYRTYEEEIKALREWAETRARAASRDKSLIDLFKLQHPRRSE